MKKNIIGIIFLTCLFFSSCKTAQFVAYGFGYQPFTFEGGYMPGSIIGIKGGVPQLQVGVEFFNSNISDKSILNCQQGGSLPDFSEDRTTSFKASLQLSPVSKVADVSSTLSNVQTFTLKVQGGQRLYLSQGDIALREALNALKKEQLQLLLDEIDGGGDVVFISEVEVYSKGQMLLDWGKNIEASLQGTISKTITIGTNPTWVNNGKLQLDYPTEVIAGYKGFKITRSYIKSVLDSKKKT